MRVLLVGGTRFIGAHAARQLVEAGADVTVFHRGKSENPILPPVRHIRDASAEYPVTSFPEAVTKADWDVVVHMVMMGEADARAAAQAFAGRAGRLVMISSGDVYRAYGRLTGLEPGEPDGALLGEDAPLRSLFYPYRAQAAKLGRYAYDYEKILAERAVRDAGLPAVILRLPKVYGAEDNANLATVYGFAQQPQWRWTHGHVDNVARAIVLAAAHPAAPGRIYPGRIYNVGEANTPTMGERLTRLPSLPSPSPQAPPFDCRHPIAYDTTRIRDELGFCEIVDEANAMLTLAKIACGAAAD